MQPIQEPSNPESEEFDTKSPLRLRRRLIACLSILLVVLLLVFIPPLITFNRLQRRIATNISAALGRPVHFDPGVTLSLLPLPGFTLKNFVVEEDPAFGSEPILRADEVHANVRIRSLWTAHVEFSKISLTDPSVNLVHTANGQWNLQSILIHASHIQAAPTAQRFAGAAPRFPYIEATGARINLKLDQEKTPYALTDADFALWLPEPRQWHFRLEAHPVRTDIAPADAGTLRLEGTLGNSETRATALAQVPIDLHGDWRELQLGGLTRLVLGRDAGLRGDLTLTLNILGEVGHANIATNIQLAHGRRADFVPTHLLSLEAACQAHTTDTFHAFSGIECHWPPADSSTPSVLILAADVLDTRHPTSSSAGVTLPALPAATFLDWLRVATSRPPAGLIGPGVLAGTLAWHPADSTAPPPTPVWSGELEFSGESLQAAALGPEPLPLGDILLRSTPPPAAETTHSQATPPHAGPAASSFDLLPISLPLGGRQPVTLEGHFDATGYTLHLTGSAIPSHLLALADAIPQFGDGLRQLLTPGPTDAPVQPRDSNTETPTHFDLSATRLWGGPQTWRETQTTPPARHRR
jgi:AsmA family